MPVLKKLTLNKLIIYSIYKAMGFKAHTIAPMIDLAPGTITRWERTNPKMKRAKKIAEKVYEETKKKSSFKSLKENIIGRLPDDLREIWERIRQADFNSDTRAHDKAIAMLNNSGQQAKMALWFHAWLTGNFNVYEACRLTSVPSTTIEGWKNDPEFHALFTEMEKIKDDIFESSFVKLAQEGNPFIVGIAAKSRLKDRGYNPQVDINVNGAIEHKHTYTVDLTKLELPDNVLDTILEAVRAKELKEGPVHELEE